MQSETPPHTLLTRQNEICNGTVSHEFATFHAKQNPLHTTSCLWNETKSVIILFHMRFLQYNYTPRFIPMQGECGMALASRGKPKTEYRAVQL